ncbi:MAG: shikimate kinase [Bacillota bacterium]
MKTNIVLTGFMGTGKTSVGKRLAVAMGKNFIDTDNEIERVTGITIPEMFSRCGEVRFRSEETLVVLRVAAMENCVISTGGGVVLRRENMQALRERGRIVCLTASPEVIQERVLKKSNRPLLSKDQSQERIKEMLAIREPYYRDADLVVDTTSLDIEAVTQIIIKFICEGSHNCANTQS